jgi:type VI secretion system protein ImpF
MGRLIGEEPAWKGGHGGARNVRRAMEEHVRRDLESLLNTRWRCRSWPPGLDELEQSLVNYGIPDFSAASFGDPVNQRDLRRIIELSIKRFEPRLRNIRVILVERGGVQDRLLHFKIEAELSDGVERRLIAFETALDTSSASFQVGLSNR